MTSCKEREPITASLLGYLEAIFQLERSSRVARAKDIADRMNVRSASVTGALKALSARGLIHYSPYSYVTLTSEGRDVAREIVRRTGIVRDFLTEILHLGPQEADANARRIEHAVAPSVIDKLVRFLEFVKLCPRTDGKWLDAFVRFYRDEPRALNCTICMEACVPGAGGVENGAPRQPVPFVT